MGVLVVPGSHKSLCSALASRDEQRRAHTRAGGWSTEPRAPCERMVAAQHEA